MVYQSLHQILVQGFRVTGLFAGQYNTEDYSTLTGVLYSIGGSAHCSSHIIFILVLIIFHCSIVHVGVLFIAIRQTQYVL